MLFKIINSKFKISLLFLFNMYGSNETKERTER